MDSLIHYSDHTSFRRRPESRADRQVALLLRIYHIDRPALFGGTDPGGESCAGGENDFVILTRWSGIGSFSHGGSGLCHSYAAERKWVFLSYAAERNGSELTRRSGGCVLL